MLKISLLAYFFDFFSLYFTSQKEPYSAIEMNQATVSKFIAASLSQKARGSHGSREGMVVTISRDTGCEGIVAVEHLVNLLNKYALQKRRKATWHYVSKEILEESAKRLNLHPDKVTRLLNAQDKNLFEEMLLGFSSANYPSDLKIKNTLKDVIQSIADEGNVVILGRGGVSIVEHSERVLHVKLTAPLDWRIKQVQTLENLSPARSKQFIERTDRDRKAMKTFYLGREITYRDYDMVFNVSSLSQEEIAQAIYEVIIHRNSLK